MNREETKKMIPIMQAYVDGAEIECRGCGEHLWQDTFKEPRWLLESLEYRIKPKPREFLIQVSEGWRTGDSGYICNLNDSPLGGNWIKVREIIN